MSSIENMFLKLYNENRIIRCCSDSYNRYKAEIDEYLDLFINDQWISIKPSVDIKNYKYLSHCYSPHCLSVNFPDYYKEEFGVQAPFCWISNRQLIVPSRKEQEKK